jgi:hypothetical protein
VSGDMMLDDYKRRVVPIKSDSVFVMHARTRAQLCSSLLLLTTALG